jgi:hypothetical protein
MTPKPAVTDALIAFAPALEEIGVPSDAVERSMPFESWQPLGGTWNPNSV